MNKSKPKGPYELSTRPAMAENYRESFAWYVTGPGTGGYHGGYYGSPFNLRVMRPKDNKPDDVALSFVEEKNPEWWDKAVELMNFAYEQGREAERRHIRETVLGALGVKQ